MTIQHSIALFGLLLCTSPVLAEETEPAVLSFAFGQVTTPEAPGWHIGADPSNMPFAHRKISDTHSIVAGVKAAIGFPNETAYLLRTQPDLILDDRLDGLREELDQGRFPVTSFEPFPWERDGAKCRGFRVVAEDAFVADAQGTPYAFRALGVICIVSEHPAYLEVHYSERHDPSEQDYGALEREARALFSSLVLW